MMYKLFATFLFFLFPFICTAATPLDLLEQQVNAKQAIAAHDEWTARTALRNILEKKPNDFQTWFLLYRTLLKMPADWREKEEREKAFHTALALTQNDLDRAVLLWVSSQTEEALKYAEKVAIEDRIHVLLENYPTEFAPYFLDIPERADLGSACVTWTYPLKKRFRYEEVLTLTPHVEDISVIARGNQLCVEGLSFGRTYHLTFKTDFPGEAVKTEEPISLVLPIPHRRPFIRFRERGFILPQHGPQQLPFMAVNVPEVKVKIIHVPERNIHSLHDKWFTNGFSRWELYKLTSREGEVIWEGTYYCQGEQDKVVVSGLPIDEMMGKKLKPGVYVIQADLHEHSYDTGHVASQVFVVSDIGLSTYWGPDGLHVTARSLAHATPLSEVEITLVALNNRVLETIKTDHEGYAHFPPGMIKGTDGNRPAFLEATQQGEQFTVFNLQGDAFDLSDRGVKGRTPQKMESYLFTDRGIYRPGETVHLMHLLRDQKSEALSHIPLTFVLSRPDGLEVHRKTLQDAGNGGRVLDFLIPSAAFTGMWTASVWADRMLSQIQFEVNDFIPPRIEVKSKALPEEIQIDTHYYFGAPGANLKVEATSQLVIADPPLAWQNYYFGLEEEKWTPLGFKHLETMTDPQGHAVLGTVVNAKPQTTHLLSKETTVTVFEIGGRARIVKQRVPFWHQAYAIGLSPLFKDRTAVGEAHFHIIALNPAGQLEKREVRVTLLEEQEDYVWYRSGSRWQYERVVRDRVIETKLFMIGKKPTPLALPLSDGRYRLEVLDEKEGIASSFRFGTGWYYAAQQAENQPDKVEMVIDKEGSRVKITPPFGGMLFLACATQNNFAPLYTGIIEKEGITLDLPSPAAGDYLVATVYRKEGSEASPMPARAVGVAYREDKKSHEAHQFSVRLNAPRVIAPSQSFEVTAYLPENTEGRLMVAVVDEAILSLTGYPTPNPEGYFFAQTALAYGLRDNYGYLINPYGVQAGSFQVGGDAGVQAQERALTALPARPFKNISLFSGIIETKGKTSVKIPFQVPEFSGKLRIMAVAWDGTRLGHADRSLLVQEAVDLYFAAPSFLAPGDVAKIPLILRENAGKAGNYTLNVQGKEQVLHLNPQEEVRWPVVLKADRSSKIISLHASLKGKLQRYQRSIEIPVRSGVQSIALRQYGVLKPKESLSLQVGELSKQFQPTDRYATVLLGATPLLGADQFIQDLKSYPYFCLEQTTSRLLSMAYGETDLTPGMNQLLSLQKLNGAFGLWSLQSRSEPWLSLYAADVLILLKQKNHSVPEGLLTRLMGWVKEISQQEDNHLAAYAHYLLAKEKQGHLESLRYFANLYQGKTLLARECALLGAAFAYYGEAKAATVWFEKALSSSYEMSEEDFTFGSSLRDKAMVATLLAETMQDNPAFLELMLSLMNEAKGKPYLSTQEKAWLIRAEKTAMGDVVPQAQVFKENFEKTIDLKNETDRLLYYAFTFVGEPLTIDQLPQKGFQVKREVYTLEGELATLDKLKSGELYVVVLTGRVLEENHHLLLVDPLPAGFEIEDPQFDWQHPATPASRQEKRADRLMAAFDQPLETFTTIYLVRAVTPGDFTYPPTYLEAMYQPQYFQYGMAQPIHIE